MSQLVFNDETARQIDAAYQIEDAVRRRSLARAELAAAPGERILDVGCGPGYYCAELADEVGSDGSIVGVDASAPMLALARRRCEGRAVTFHQSDVLSLPVEDEDFDAALCVQVLEYVEDATAVLAEIRRTLRPGGRVLVWDIDWATLSWHSDDPARMERVMRAWDEHLTHPSLPRTLAPRLRAAGFEEVRVTAYPFVSAAFGPETYVGGIAPLIADFVVGRKGLTDEDVAGWLDEQRTLDERGEFFFTCNQFCFTATRSG